MKIKQGTKIIVNDNRKGKYKAVAEKDFDTETDEWYPVVAAEYIAGYSTDWVEGEHVPCRRGLSTITLVEN